jgi:hypothetical protein
VYELLNRLSSDLWSPGVLYLDFLCPLAVKVNLGELHYSLVTSCLKGRCTSIVYNLHVHGHQGVGQACVCVCVYVCVLRVAPTSTQNYAYRRIAKFK